jgi:hypothetical protein
MADSIAATNLLARSELRELGPEQVAARDRSVEGWRTLAKVSSLCRLYLWDGITRPTRA